MDNWDSNILYAHKIYLSIHKYREKKKTFMLIDLPLTLDHVPLCFVVITKKKRI